jgi:hypothetical protein
MFFIHLTKLMMNVSWFHVSCIQEMDYRPHFTCSGLLDFLGHCKHRTVRKRGSVVCKWRPCLPKGPTNSAHVHHHDHSAAAAILAMELILCVRLLHTRNVMCWRFLRGVQKCGSKILSTYSCRHSLKERAVSLNDTDGGN